MLDLYRNAVPESGFTFDTDTLVAALERIYRREINPRRQIDEGLFRTIWDVFNQATAEGFAGRLSTARDIDFINSIRHNNAVFSAFKVHRLQNDVAGQMLDGEGNLKSFRKWREDVQDIVDHHTDLWLETEYDTAIKRANLAADWIQFEREADILPNLRWTQSTSIEPRESHKLFWGLVLPITHSFWNNHRPGDEWGCKCGLEATDDSVITELAIPDSADSEPSPGLGGNPAHTGKIFSDDHPYIANAYQGASRTVQKFIKTLE